ncbi:MAG: hypothetical protein Edafosvirus5_42 [Edafosvirus sp.]|uniref:MORN repeat-containing protein n=1 Tax=Edafosvirus sp. TaxID=2487765 RepID=A0A3G4ZUX4_9VIRU|nr:MAG: hypothetical protein Edafosvirus5_42 [Edafosvirus sp.]
MTLILTSIPDYYDLTKDIEIKECNNENDFIHDPCDIDEIDKSFKKVLSDFSDILDNFLISELANIVVSYCYKKIKNIFGSKFENQYSEYGYMLNGKKVGTWCLKRHYSLIFSPGYDTKYMEEYKNGKLYGKSVQFVYNNNTNIFLYAHHNGLHIDDFKKHYIAYKLHEGSYINDMQEGPWIYYHKYTTLKESEGQYINGLMEGKWIFYKIIGDIHFKYYEGNYINGRMDGTWKYYYPLGNLEMTREYDHGILKTKRVYYGSNKSFIC